MKQLIVSIVVATVISVILTMFVNNTKFEAEVVSDTVSTKVDTLTFEQEMEIVDSLVKAQYGVVYEILYDVPDVEYISGDVGYQTLVRYPNGMPKIVAEVTYSEGSTAFPELLPRGYGVFGAFFLFLSEHGRVIAEADMMVFKRWRCACEDSKPCKITFDFKDPNLCRNIK